jgi:HSP20 family protein
MASHMRVLEPGFGDSFESALRRFFAPVPFETNIQPLQMRLDVADKDTAYVVKADLPGVKKEDINVRIDGNIIQIDAEVKQEKETRENGEKVLRSERYFGNVSRTFSLAQDVDDTKANARYADGVLTLELPKKSSSASKKVAVQ